MRGVRLESGKGPMDSVAALEKTAGILRVESMRPLAHLTIEETFKTYDAYFAKHKRKCSVTDCKWISDTKLVFAHRGAHKVYLAEVSHEGITVLDSIFTESNAPDVLDVWEDVIWLSNYSQTLTRVQLVDGATRLRLLPSLTIPTDKKFHGLHAFQGTIWATESYDQVYNPPTPCGLVRINPLTLDFQKIPTPQGTRCKDIAFDPTNPTRCIALYTDNYRATRAPREHPGDRVYDCVVVYYAYDPSATPMFRVLDSRKVPDAHPDVVVFYGGAFYFTVSLAADSHSCGYLFRGTVQKEKLSPFTQTTVESFPHGLDIRGGKLAYTSYGTSTLYVFNL